MSKNDVLGIGTGTGVVIIVGLCLSVCVESKFVYVVNV